MLHVKAALALASGCRLLRPLVATRARSSLTSAQASASGRAEGGHDSPVRPVRPGRAGRESAAGPGVASVNFAQTQEAYKSKESLELLRSLLVFKLCSYDFLVERNQEVSCCRVTAHTDRCWVGVRPPWLSTPEAPQQGHSEDLS